MNLLLVLKKNFGMTKAEFLNIGKSDYKTCGKDYANFAFDHLICFYQE